MNLPQWLVSRVQGWSHKSTKTVESGDDGGRGRGVAGCRGSRGDRPLACREAPPESRTVPGVLGEGSRIAVAAIAPRPALFNTRGGLVVDVKARVLTREGGTDPRPLRVRRRGAGSRAMEPGTPRGERAAARSGWPTSRRPTSRRSSTRRSSTRLAEYR